MPEHDTFDLDAAFRALEADVTTLATAPGARAAVARARHRRRTIIGAATAVAALIVAGSAGGVYVHRQNDGGLASLPGASTFDAAALSEATTGWASGWAEPTKADGKSLDSLADPRCLHNLGSGDSSNDPVRSGAPLWLSSEGEVVLGALGEWNDADIPKTSYAEATAAVDRCTGASANATYSWDGAQGRSWTISSHGPTQHLWIAREGQAIALLWAGGPSGPVPSDVDQRVMTALVAGLQSRASYVGRNVFGTTSTESTSSSEVTAESFDAPTEGQLTTAFGSWPSGLTTEGNIESMPTTPCLPRSFDASSGGGGASIGDNAVENDFSFDSPTAAASALQHLSNEWQSCGKTDYAVTTVDVPGEGSVTVASSEGAAAATNWAVQNGPFLIIVSIDGGSNPPESVSAAVGSLLYDALAHPQKPGQAHIAPQKLKQLHQDDPSSTTSSAAVAPR